MATFPEAQVFFEYLAGWQASLPEASLPEPGRTAVLVVDLTNGFCRSGSLASPRVAAIVPPITRLLDRAWQSGVRSMALLNDNHDPQANEFHQWPVHCVRGSAETEPVAELIALPFFSEIDTFAKNSISSSYGTDLDPWLADRPEIQNFIVAGDCTDLCVYQLAMHLRLTANAAGISRRVIVPADSVDTYDLDVSTARKLGILPHPGSLLHTFFLYHMALNGVEIVKNIA